MASCFNNKYAEGYPTERRSGNMGRYYGGCENVDALEELCCDRWRGVFHTDYHVNVQPHSGSQANYAAISAVCKIGDTILSMGLADGGHLTHGAPVNFSGKMYNIVNYGLTDAGYINEMDIYNKIIKYEPKLIIIGASAYPREIDYEHLINNVIKDAVDTIGDKDYKPYIMVDMAHVAGLIAGHQHATPFGYADIITTTTHKTLRGPRGGLIFCKPELAKKIDSAVFPGAQGGPLEHVIAAKAVCAHEAMTDEYEGYIHDVIVNCQTMANEFKMLGYKLVTGGTDNHMIILDFSDKPYTGRQAQEWLEYRGIITNKETIPNEKWGPRETSGLRLGTPAMTSRGWGTRDFKECVHRIDEALRDLERYVVEGPTEF